jgi:hypothetical protein
MAYYHPDRIERRNRRKAIVLTTILYGSLFAFFLLKDDVAWEDYAPDFVLEILGDQASAPAPQAVAVEEVRP